MLDTGLGAITAVDTWIAHALNGAVHRNEAFDRLVLFCADNPFVKGAPVVASFCWLWFKRGSDQQSRRDRLVLLLFACFAALLLSLAISSVLPLRTRPLHDATLLLNKAYGVSDMALAHRTSFPSDHAVLYGAFAAGFFFISPIVGAISLAWTAVFVLLPRMYLGFHYPSDIFGGLLIGAASTALIFAWRDHLLPAAHRVALLDQRSPGLFYTLTFLILWQLTTTFGDVRAGVALVERFAVSLVTDPRPAANEPAGRFVSRKPVEITLPRP